MKTKVDISVNITAHREGNLLYRTLVAINNNINALIQEIPNTKIEVNVSLDNHDEKTKEVVDKFGFDNATKKTYSVKFGDLAESRNNLIGKSKGEYLAFFDGDDVFSLKYLLSAYRLARANKNKKVVYSVDYLVVFGGENSIAVRPEVKTNYRSALELVVNNNPVNSCIFANKEVFQLTRYEPVVRGSGYGYEDWHFVTKLLVLGVEFKKIPDGILFYRRSFNPAESLLSGQVSQNAILRRSPLFDPQTFVDFYNNRKTEKKATHDPIKPPIKYNFKTIVRQLLYRRPFTAMPVTAKTYLKTCYHAHNRLLIAIKDKVRWLSNKKSSLITQQDIIASGIDLYRNHLENILFEKLNHFNVARSSVVKIVDEWFYANSIEPLISPTEGNFINLGVSFYPDSTYNTKLYYELCMGVLELNKQKNVCIMMTPWITRGGADLILVETIKTLHKNGTSVLLITTEGNNMQWLGRIAKYAKVVNIHDYKQNISFEDILGLISRLVINVQPKYFVSLNSYYGNEIAVKYGKQIGEASKIYTYKFSLHQDENGVSFEAPESFYDNIHKIDKARIVTDCQNTVKDYMRVFGYGAEKFDFITMPIPVTKSKLTATSKPHKKVLCAGRIAPDKLIKELFVISDLLKDDDISIDIYGSIDDRMAGEYGVFSNLLKSYSNITYKGGFDKFSDIPIQNYDILLFASRSEGLPNVVLEAIGANLFVVASDVGGVGEVIEHGINGYLINDPLDAKAYADMIRLYYKDNSKESLNKKTEYNKNLYKSRSTTAMIESIKKMYDIISK